jgi:hypothetical protein
MIGQRLGTMAGNKLSKLTANKTGYGIMINNVEQLTPDEKFKKLIESKVKHEREANKKYDLLENKKTKTNKKTKQETLKRIKNDTKANENKETMHERMARLRSLRKK